MEMNRSLFGRQLPVAAGLAATIVALLSSSGARGEAVPNEKPPATGNVYAKWQNRPFQETARFPIAVWLQAPRNAPKYQALGINLFVALWEGPAAEQIAELKRHRMPVICEQNDYALKHLGEDRTIHLLDGRFEDDFAPYAVHLYEVVP